MIVLEIIISESIIYMLYGNKNTNSHLFGFKNNNNQSFGSKNTLKKASNTLKLINSIVGLIATTARILSPFPL
jgi:hypothetical protein